MTWLIPIVITLLIALWLWRRRGNRDFDDIDDVEIAIYVTLTTWLSFGALVAGGWL